MDNYPVAAPMRKMSPLPPVGTNHQWILEEGWDLQSSFPSHDRMLMGSVLCRLCASDHSFNECNSYGTSRTQNSTVLLSTLQFFPLPFLWCPLSLTAYRCPPEDQQCMVSLSAWWQCMVTLRAWWQCMVALSAWWQSTVTLSAWWHYCQRTTHLVSRQRENKLTKLGTSLQLAYRVCYARCWKDESYRRSHLAM